MKIRAPFTEEQVKQFNEQQENIKFHPYTCDRSSINCEVRFNAGDGVIVATIDELTCPCRNYKQGWIHGNNFSQPLQQ